MKRKHTSKHFLSIGVYIFVLLFAGNLVTAYVMHYYVLGVSCMTTAQVSSDSRCLYIMAGKVYEKATRSAPHQGHPCGMDVTAIIPADHINNPAAYLLPNYVANICAPAPTSTPTPKPTATSTPTPRPTVTSTPTPTHVSVVFTSTPIPTTAKPSVTATPTVTPAVTKTPAGNPTPTTISMVLTATPPVVAPTATPTPSRPILTPTATTVMLSPTPTTVAPTPTSTISPANPALSLKLTLVGIDASTSAPLHLDKAVSILVYNGTGSPSAQPMQTVQGTVSFDAPSASFINPTFNLTNVTTGQYQLFVQIPGYIKKQLLTNGNTLFSLTAGTASPVSETKLLGGDIDGNNIVDIADYNSLLRCYGLHISNPSPSCANPQSADINDDGVVDSEDYTIFLYNLYAYRQQNNVSLSPTPTATLTPTATQPTKIPVVTVTSVPKTTIAPTVTPVPPTASPKKASLIAGITDNAGILTRIFDIIVFILVCGTVGLGILKSSLFSKKKQTPPAQKPSASVEPGTDEKNQGVVK